MPPSSHSESDPVIGHVRVIFHVPIKRSDALEWSKPGLPDDPEDDAWIFEVEEAVADRVPDVLERCGPPDVEFD